MTAEHGQTNFEVLAVLPAEAQDELISAALDRSKIETERERNRVIEILPEAQDVYGEFTKPEQDTLVMDLAFSIFKTVVQNPQVTQPEIIDKVVDQLMENEPYNQLDNPQFFRTMITSAAEQLVPELRIEEQLRQMNEAVIMAHEQSLNPAEIFRDRKTYLELMRRSSTPEEVKDKHLRYLKAFSRLHFQTAETLKGVYENAGDKFDEDREANLEKLRGTFPVAPKDFLIAYARMVNEKIAEIWGTQTPASTIKGNP